MSLPFRIKDTNPSTRALPHAFTSMWPSRYRRTPISSRGDFRIRILGPQTFGPLHSAPESSKFMFSSPEKHVHSTPTAPKLSTHCSVDSEVQKALQISTKPGVGDSGYESR